MFHRWEYKDFIHVFGIMAYLLSLVQSNEDFIKQLLYKTKVTEEESLSPHLPDQYSCDACMAVVYTIGQVFMKAEKRHTKTKLTESSLVDLVDQLCENDYLWEAYGLKEIEGKKRFSGPGLEAESEFGLNMEGDLWSHRMKEFCKKVTGDIEDVELYKIFKKGTLKETLCYEEYCQKSRPKSEL